MIVGRVIPWGWIAVVGALLVLLLGQRIQVSNAQARSARAERDLAAYRETQAESARLAERSRRTTEQAWSERIERTAADGQKKLDLVRADAGRTHDLANRVQRQLADLRAAVGRATKDSDPTAASTPAEAAAGVCTELLGRAAARAAIVERFADEAHAAGSTCERAADELRG